MVQFGEPLLRDAVALVQAGRIAEAREVCRRILDREPNHAVVLHLMGVLAAQMGELEEAIACVRRAVEINPVDGEFRSNLCKLLRDGGRVEEAMAAGREAVRLWPGAAAAYLNLAAACQSGGRLAEALDVLREGCRHVPSDVGLLERLADLLRMNHHHAEAMACYQRVLQLSPERVDTLNNLGLMLHLSGDSDAALALLQKAVALQPRLVAAYLNLRGVHMERGELAAAVACQRRAMELAPGDASIHSDLILTLLYDPDTSARALQQELQSWWQCHGAPLAHEILPHPQDPSPERRLRIGYVTGDCREHVVGRAMRHLIRARDARQFEVICYADVETPDGITEEFRGIADLYRDIRGMPDQEIATLIRKDGIDILVDLSLHTARNHLPVFARQPAPVQVTFAGYPGTTGLPTIDYRLSDSCLDPPGGDELVYAEKTIRLPDSFFFYDGLENPAPPIGALPALANGYVTFGCLCSFCKVNPQVLALWARVLAAVERSRLVLLAPVGSHRQRTLDFLASLGIAAERVSFFGKRPRRDYLELHNQVDIALDTLPYNGHMTSLDALYMGVPVVTLRGESVVGRGGVSILSNLKLQGWIAQTPDAFVEIASALAADRPQLASLRANLRDRLRASPLMDAGKMAASLEQAYRQLWRKWCASQTESGEKGALRRI